MNPRFFASSYSLPAEHENLANKNEAQRQTQPPAPPSLSMSPSSASLPAPPSPPPSPPPLAPFYYSLDAHHSTAVEVCNVGASLIECDEYFFAIETLRDATELLSKPAVQIPAGDDGALGEYVRSNNDVIERAEMRLLETDAYNDAYAREVLDGTTKKKKKKSPIVVDDECGLLIHADPIHLPLSAAAAGPKFVMEEAAAAVLYNLALAHHLAGSATPCHEAAYLPQRRRLLEKALVLYDMCLSTAIKLDASAGDNNWRDGDNSDDLDVLTLTMAALNNSGQIRLRHLGEHARGKMCFRDLEAVYASAAKSPSQSSVSENMDVFSFNIIVAGQMNGAPTA